MPELGNLPLHPSIIALQLGMQNPISSIANLKCTSVPERVEISIHPNDHYAPTRRTASARIASGAVLRELLGTCVELAAQLQSIADTENLRDYALNKHDLCGHVIPEANFIVQYCDEVLQRKGTADSPVTSKLIDAAQEISALIATIQNRVNLSLEYTELTDCIKEIRRAAHYPALDAEGVKPLLFSLQSLPERIDQFASSAKPRFIAQASSLRVSYKETQLLVEQKRDDLELSGKLLEMRLSDATPKRVSPERYSMPALRGFRHRQQLSSHHARVSKWEKMPPVPKPTKIVDRCVVGPTWEDLYGFQYGTTYRRKWEKTHEKSRAIQSRLHAEKRHAEKRHAEKRHAEERHAEERHAEERHAEERHAEERQDLENASTWKFTPKLKLNPALDGERKPLGLTARTAQPLVLHTPRHRTNSMLASPENSFLETPLAAKVLMPRRRAHF